MADTIRELEDKINSSKTTFKIYQEEIKNIETKLSEKGITVNDVEQKLEAIMGEIETLGKKEKLLIRKIKKGLEKIERRF